MSAVVVERVDRRYHGALRMIDAVSGVEVRAPLAVTSAGAAFFRNRSGYYVIDRVPGLDAHRTAFAAQPAAPAVGSITVDFAVSDASGRYLARRASVALPRDPDPGRADAVDSLFRPHDVVLYPAPAAALATNWCVLRVSVVRETTGVALPGVLLRVVRSSGGNDTVVGRGLGDARGEALVAIRGIPITTWETGPGAVVATGIAATLEAIFDPAAPEIPDPDDLEARRATLVTVTVPVVLAAGRVIVMPLAMPTP